MMKICKVISLLFWGLLLGAGPVFGQQLAEDDLLLPPQQLLDQDLLGNGNSTFLEQAGSQNLIEVNQSQIGREKINLIRVLQLGQLNEAYLSQRGNGNQLALIQKGDENYHQMNLDGLNNDLVIFQDGDHNRVIQDLSQTNELNIEFLQIGHENEIIQILDGVSNQEFKLIQNGDGLRAIIQHPQ